MPEKLGVCWSIHIWDVRNVSRMVRLISKIVSNDDVVWITTGAEQRSKMEGEVNQLILGNAKVFAVGNEAMDWSGYLLSLQRYRGKKFMFLNDSIVSRRKFFRHNIRTILAEVIKRPRVLVGEIDTFKTGIALKDGRQSSWVSSFCFGLSCTHSEKEILLNRLTEKYSQISNHETYVFEGYLQASRPEFLDDQLMLSRKKTAMHLEQLMSFECRFLGIEVLSPFKFNLLRKFQKKIEGWKKYQIK